MDELEKINWSNDFYSDIFSLHLDSLFSTVELENLEMNENRTVCEVEDTTNQASERVVFAEATIETNNLPVPDESRFPLTSNELVEETLKQAENKNTNRSTATWMKIWSSWAKSRNINVSIETMAPATLNEVLQKFYLEVSKQDGSEYEPDFLKIMQAALERHLSAHKYPYSLINSREFASSRAVLDAKAKQLRMHGKKKKSRTAVQHSRRGVFLVQWPVRWPQWSGSNQCKLQNFVRTLWFSRPPRPLRSLTYKTLRLCGSSLREEKWRNAYVSTRIQRRPVLVA